MKILVILLVFLSLQAFAQVKEKSDFCKRTLNDHKEHIGLLENRMFFENDGGIFNGGVCWWHSRLQRAAEYLVVFRPDLQKPTASQVNSIVDALVRHLYVVEIPGYSSFYDFTKDFQPLIQKKLNQWQLTDALIRQAWIKGLKGRSSTTAEKLKMIMNRAFEIVENQKQIVFAKLQIKGVVSHAWLITKMQAQSNGYQLEIIDSNWPTESLFYEYKFGDESFFKTEYGNFVPYIDFQDEMQSLIRSKQNYCNLID